MVSLDIARLQKISSSHSRFGRQLARLRAAGIDTGHKGYPSYVALKRPAFVGHWVNDIVWDRLVPGARKKLNEVNPRLPAGYRKNKHHSHTTEDYGLPELKAHLIKVMAYMDAAANDTQFTRMLNRGTPKFGDTYEMLLGDVYH
jgi:hypothetical protein